MQEALELLKSAVGSDPPSRPTETTTQRNQLQDGTEESLVFSDLSLTRDYQNFFNRDLEQRQAKTTDYGGASTMDWSGNLWKDLR